MVQIKHQFTVRSDQAFFLSVHRRLLMASQSISEIDQDPDGFVYILICAESTFG